MTNEIKIAILAGIVLLVAIIVLILVNNTKKTAIHKEIDNLNVRYNTIKTIPLAFKLNNAQAMAKRNKETAEKIVEYYEKYETAQKHIDAIEHLMEEIEDDLASKNYRALKTSIPELKSMLDESENEVNKIDEYLEQFAMKETEQRDISARLKEVYLDLKMHVNENSNSLAISYNGVCKKLEKIEELFSQSEEWLYANDYVRAQQILEEISANIKVVRADYKALPDLVQDAKGVLPVLLEEVDRQYALSRQRGVYLDHLNISAKLEVIRKDLNECVKSISLAEIDGVREKLDNDKTQLNEILDSLEKEINDYNESKTMCEEIFENIEKIKTLHNYVSISYAKEKARFSMENIGEYIKDKEKDIDDYKAEYIKVFGDVKQNDMPASKIRVEVDALLKATNKDVEALTGYKKQIDKNSNDEQRAKTQLIKLQIVLNEIEVKVMEYHLPAIAASYRNDLQTGRNQVKEIKDLLKEIPLNIELLNEKLQNTIDYVYTFYNNVNNVVGMAIMVENAIVFGNKYRSTYPEVDRDLSKAEFSYLNGEYTKALTMAISCMETLFPNKANEKILENR